MANTVYQKATGGTPIISWITNHIRAVLNIMTEVFDSISNDTSLFSKTEFGEVLEKKKTLLKKQLQLLHGDSYDAEEVFSLNKKMDLSDDWSELINFVNYNASNNITFSVNFSNQFIFSKDFRFIKDW